MKISRRVDDESKGFLGGMQLVHAVHHIDVVGECAGVTRTRVVVVQTKQQAFTATNIQHPDFLLSVRAANTNH